MARKRLLGAQVKRLLHGVSDRGGQHLNEIETDLVQTCSLLHQAIEKLSASFMAIHNAVALQQDAVDALLADPRTSVEAAGAMRARQREIGLHVNAAVTGLQFQDMTDQLIGRTVRRVAGLRSLLETMGAGGAGMAVESGVDEVIAALDAVNKAIEEQSIKLESMLSKSVCQTHMESGDIELF